MKTFYVTTPIYYVNGKPSIGHAYTAIAADILARYHRSLGEEVAFQSGTDENSQKNVEAARAAGREDDVQGYLDEMADLWKRTFDALQLTHTRFIRTTESNHLAAVEMFWKAVEAKGDIYQGSYEGLYCQGCEAFVTEADLVNGNCPLHQKPPIVLKEKNYFFRLTAYREALLEHILTHPRFVLPESRRNEIVSYIRNFMTDVSISRETMKWGIPVPSDPAQRIYVWFDALINYITGAGYGTDQAAFEKWWPAQVQLVGKDILKFHCALWPAMLLSVGLPLPESVFAHGFFTVDGQKMSKSLGNVVDPVEMVERYGHDALRYFLMREIPFGGDGDFSEARLQQRYDGDLGNELGNLAHRVLTMAEKYVGGVVPERADGFLGEAWPAYRRAMEECRLHDALEAAWSLVRQANQYVDQRQPWTLAKNAETKALADTLYVLLETLRHLAHMLHPFLPGFGEGLFQRLGLGTSDQLALSPPFAEAWGGLEPGTQTSKGEPLFPKREES
ncbi:methionine--tRNA ligase [Candidatus Uhrbacteria bacterium]|nr:methionine--tRNA ligase [Candidatus Uhrbacteria bacterium]MBI4598939.1 methionine--tRNA ligase [Candidatus Uhrbacteria bacterium]